MRHLTREDIQYIKKVIESLISNDCIKLNILALLLKKETPELRSFEIAEKLKKEKKEIDSHLLALKKIGFVHGSYYAGMGPSHIYKLTEAGKKFLSIILSEKPFSF